MHTLAMVHPSVRGYGRCRWSTQRSARQAPQAQQGGVLTRLVDCCVLTQHPRIGTE